MKYLASYFEHNSKDRFSRDKPILILYIAGWSQEGKEKPEDNQGKFYIALYENSHLVLLLHT